MQPDLFAHQPAFDGATFAPDLDGVRLSRQLAQVLAYMRGRGWQTLAEIERATGFPQASISARLRDARKPKFGGYTVERRRRTLGQFEYRIAED